MIKYKGLLSRVESLEQSTYHSNVSKVLSIEPPDNLCVYAEKVLNTFLLTYKIVDLNNTIISENEIFNIENILCELSSDADEYEYNRKMTKVLKSVLLKHHKLFNTELTQWLNRSFSLSYTYAYTLKPDFLVIDPLLIEEKERTKTIEPIGYLFGIPAHPRYNSYVPILFEGKFIKNKSKQMNKLSLSDKGAAFRYGYSLSYFQENTDCFVVLYNTYGYNIYKFHNLELIELIECSWYTKGSLQYLKNYLNRNYKQDYLSFGIRKMIEYFQLEEKVEFLGYGGTSDAFKVKKISGKCISDIRHTLVLKIAICDTSIKLKTSELELQTMQKYSINNNIKKYIIPLIDYTIQYIGNNNDIPVIGMLFEEVGTPIDILDVSTRKHLLLGLQLLHENNCIHNDPRYSNAISINNSLRWIDLRGANIEAISPNFLTDLNILILSLPMYKEFAMNGNVSQLMLYYDRNPTKENMLNIFNKLEELMLNK